MRFVSVAQDRWTATHDSHSMSQRSEIPFLQSPIPLIPATLNKLNREGVQALPIVPNLPSQPYWSELKSIKSRFMILGDSKDTLIPGGRMKKQNRRLLPGKLIAAWMEETQEFNYLDGFQEREVSPIQLLRKQQEAGIQYGEGIDSPQADQTSHENQANCSTAIAILFWAQGVSKDNINGFVLQQIMKKLYVGIRQQIKEEPIWQYNDLLKYVNEKAIAKYILSEKQHLRIVIALVVGYSTLRLAEGHRSVVKDMKDYFWQINSSMIKVHETQIEIIFRPVQNLNVCPTEQLRSWYERRSKNDKNKPFLQLTEKKWTAAYEEASNAVRWIMAEAGIPDNPAVTSIRKSSMTKSIDQGAINTQIIGATRHKKGTDTAAHHYDKNLNDNLRQRLSEFE
ncbi:MAG: hypothetical protein EZS28_006917 [Streblomastix strix]|uniref:Tyr recombinase domain-containing protein n=1 Tax=Streblomastix strix TaxID=222440 RepID=A0A5J4WSP5_9EUKA|nr:MAG: hypothetical protein EZS28_006917 [Streblomastix strix]